jgi:hypothetical protein
VSAETHRIPQPSKDTILSPGRTRACRSTRQTPRRQPRHTLYNHIPNLRELRAVGRARAAAEDARAARVAALPSDSRRSLPTVDQYEQLA